MAVPSSTSTPTSTTTPIPALKLTPQNNQDLHHISDLLHLLHHRNHNQHRRSSWYRHFSIFRRHLSTLLSHASILAEQPTTHLGKHRKKATDAKVNAQIALELGFWRDVLVPKWQHAFAQVVADGRFAVLGVVLLATLAQVARIVGLVGVYDAMGEEEVRRVLERFAREEWVGEEGDEGVKIEREAEDGAGVEDYGEALNRDESDDDRGIEAAMATEKEVRKGANSRCMAPEQDVLKQSLVALKSVSSDGRPEKRTAKQTLTSSKKKKKKNAIDDLFNF